MQFSLYSKEDIWDHGGWSIQLYISQSFLYLQDFKTVQALIFGMLISHNLEKKARLEKIRFPEKNHRIGDLLKLLKVVMYFLYLLNMDDIYL